MTRGAATVRMPAEWEPHAATWIAWPHHEPDWPGKFEPIPWVYAEIVRVLHRSEPVQILCQDAEAREDATRHLRAHGVDLGRVRLHQVPTDRVWVRDSGPTGVFDATGAPHWVAWSFTAWAKYDNYTLDRHVAREVARLSGVPSIDAVRPDNGQPLVLEGGGIETDGAGTMLVTEEWLLSNVQVRNPGLDRAGYESAFSRYLGIQRTIWLGEGAVGDDTHGHIDDIARFVDAHTILLSCEDDPADANFARSQDNLRRLTLASKSHPGRLEVVKLPFPRPLMMDGERLPASYANFYVANGVVIVPTFNDRNDRYALNTIAECFPGREVIGINCVDLVWGLGTLHCLTQQQPAGMKRKGRRAEGLSATAGGAWSVVSDERGLGIPTARRLLCHPSGRPSADPAPCPVHARVEPARRDREGSLGERIRPRGNGGEAPEAAPRLGEGTLVER